MIKVLAIGNSFSQDATYYLHQIAAADGVELKVVNLYIGGSNLERHYNNLISGAADYLYEENGKSNGKYVSANDVLPAEKWDYVVTLQASYDSGIEQSYHPYLDYIAGVIKQKAPQAQLLMQQTWAYDIDSFHSEFHRYAHDSEKMHQMLVKAYKNAAEGIGARLIPCGDVVHALRQRPPFLYGHGGMSICRDGYHMNYIYGRYLLAAIWYRYLTGNSVSKNTYIPHTDIAPNAICDENVLRVIKQTVDELV